MKTRNPVAKFMRRVVKSGAHKDRTKYTRKQKHRGGKNTT